MCCACGRRGRATAPWRTAPWRTAPSSWDCSNALKETVMHEFLYGSVVDPRSMFRGILY
jgi:hypothetical protein